MPNIRTPKEIMKEMEDVRSQYRSEGWSLGLRASELVQKLDALATELSIARLRAWRASKSMVKC